MRGVNTMLEEAKSLMSELDDKVEKPTKKDKVIFISNLMTLILSITH